MNRFERMHNTVREWEPSRQTVYVGSRLRQLSSPMRLSSRSRKDSSDSLSGSVCSHTISRCTSPTNKRYFQRSSSEAIDGFYQNALVKRPRDFPDPRVPGGDVQYNAYYVSGGVLFAPEGFSQDAGNGQRKLVHIQAPGSESETDARRVHFDTKTSMRGECHQRRTKQISFPTQSRPHHSTVSHSNSGSRRFMRFHHSRSGGRRDYGRRDASPDRLSRSRSPSPTNIQRQMSWEPDNSQVSQSPQWENAPPKQQGPKWEMPVPPKVPGQQWENDPNGQRPRWETSKSKAAIWDSESKKSHKSEWDSDSLKSHGSPWEKDYPKSRSPHKSSSPHSIHSHHNHRHRHHHGKHRHNHKWKNDNSGEWNANGRGKQQFPYSMMYYPKPSHEGWLSPVNSCMDPGGTNPTHEGWLIPVRERLGNDSPTHVGWISPVHGPVRPFNAPPSHEGWITPVRSPFGPHSTLHEGRISPVHQPLCPLSSATGTTTGRMEFTTTGHGALQAVHSTVPGSEEGPPAMLQQICTRKQEEAQVRVLSGSSVDRYKLPTTVKCYSSTFHAGRARPRGKLQRKLSV